MARLIILLLACLATSCDKSPYSIISRFPVEEQLALEGTIPYDIVKFNLSQVKEVGNYYLLSLFNDEEYRFAVTDKEFNEITRTCRAGNGPGEFLSAELCGTESISDDTLRFYVHDFLNGKLSKITIDLTCGQSKIEECFSFEPLTRAYYELQNGYRLINGSNNRYYLQDTCGNKTYFEGWGNDINGAIEYQEWFIPKIQSSDMLNSDSTRLLINDRHSPALWVHTLSGALVRNVCIGKGLDDLPESYWGGHFKASYMGDDYIISLYNESDDYGETFSSWLLIFDKDLNPLARYALEGQNRTFTVDSKTGRVLMLGYDYEEIHVYNLSKYIF